MNANKPFSKLMALVLAIAMTLSVIPLSVSAKAEGADCTHEHDEDCGYVEGAPCGHDHDEDCGYGSAAPCGHHHDETCGWNGETGTGCTHQHDEDCGWADATPCTHTQHDDCGYIEAVPCGHQHDESCGGVSSVDPDAGAGIITAFAPLDETVRRQETYGTASPNLPETVMATVDGVQKELAVTWLDENGYADSAAAGLYIFTAETPEGYTLAEGVSAPVIAVMRKSNPLSRMAGAGTASNPLQIISANQLAEIAGLVNEDKLETVVGQATVYLKLMNDIALVGEWTPIGNSSNEFKGHFDGNNKTISGLKIIAPSADCIGLFGAVSGSVKNLGLAGVNIQGGSFGYIGGVAGLVIGSVENCHVTGKIGGSDQVGGVAGGVGGVAGGVGGSVTNCYSSAAVSGSGYRVGGVVGTVNGGSVESCYSTGAVNGNNEVGGVAGAVSTGGVENCYSTGAVSGNSEVGGVVGTVNGGSVENCYSTGAVGGNSSVGGVAGYVGTGGSVSNCYSIGAVGGTNGVGGVAGYVDGGSVESCAALNPSVNGTSNAGRVAGLVAGGGTLGNNVAFAGMTDGTGATFSGANTLNGLNGADLAAADARGSIGGRFTTDWITHESRLPILAGLDGQDRPMPAHLYSPGILIFSGLGTQTNPYQIDTAEKLKVLADLVNAGTPPYASADKYYELTANITLGGEWTPIGTSTNPFKGNFDGNNKTISGLYINTSENNQGLFGYVDDSGTASVIIKNVHLADCYIVGGDNVGGIAGNMAGGYSSGGFEVLNCSVSGRIVGADNVGGIAGVTNADIRNSYTTCEVVASNGNAGGIAGRTSGANVTDCYSTGAVYAYSGGNAGGISGMATGQISRCYSTGYIYGDNYAGGIAGALSGTGGGISDCAALNPSIDYGNSGTAGRVAGARASANNILSGNVAFSGMYGSTLGNIGPSGLDGESKDANALQTASGFPVGLTQSPWVYAANMLPGLGATVEMPFHLKTGNYFAGGNGTSTNPYQIATAKQLEYLAILVNAGDPDYNDKYYKLTADITLTGECTPIGSSSSSPFKGHFDGGNHIISGLYISSIYSTYSDTGLFGYVDGGSVTNLGLVGVDVTGGSYVGGVAGVLDNGASVTNCYVTGAVNGTGNFVGGVAGNIDLSSSVTNCYSTATVIGDNGVGGVAGGVYGGSVTNCYSTGAVSGTGDDVGGVAGGVSGSSVTNCYSTGAVSGTGDYVGGVAGGVYGTGSVENCVALNPSVKGAGSNVGRVVGYYDQVLYNNYAFVGMSGGSFPYRSGMSIDGTDMNKLQAVTPVFWTTEAMGWSASVWTLEQGKLPTLKGLAGQDGEPGLYLTNLPTGVLTITPETETAVPGRSITFTVKGMESWSKQTITWDSVTGLTPSATNGVATLTVPTDAAGTTIIVTARNANSGQSVSATVTVYDDWDWDWNWDNNGDGSYSGGSSWSAYNTTDKQPNMPKVATMTYTGTVQNKRLIFTITKSMAQEAINKAGTNPNGIALEFDITNSSIYNCQTINIEGDALDLIKSSGVKYIQVQTDIFRFRFDSAAIISLDSQTTGTVMVSADPAELSDAAKAAIGSRPVFDFTVKDSTGKTVTSYGSGRITRGIKYTAADTEKSGNLFIVKIVDSKVQWIDKSSYNDGWVTWSSDSNSVYGVGYKTPAPAFTDTTSHWGKDNIDFVASRDLISGTSATTFAPDTAITRAAFLMALGKLSGADVSGYTTSSFTDVPATNPAMPYIEWAVENKITQGIGDNKFGPDNPITREQMAVMMVNYAKATGYTLPVSRQAVTFADSAKISASTKDAVKAIQQTGVISGKPNNLFDPQGSATRAEASAILRRFVELVITRVRRGAGCRTTRASGSISTQAARPSPAGSTRRQINIGLTIKALWQPGNGYKSAASGITSTWTASWP